VKEPAAGGKKIRFETFGLKLQQKLAPQNKNRGYVPATFYLLILITLYIF